MVGEEYKRIRIPFNYEPRGYQVSFFEAMDSGIRRACLVWHRRSGKDKTCLNFTIKEMAKRVGCYYYYFPTMKQGRKSLWDGMDYTGFKFRDHFPKEFVKKTNDAEMQIEAVNGSIFQVVGTDNMEVVGPNPIGNVLSEYSLQDPDGYEYIKPIIAENDGWLIANFTPRGHNHGYHLANMAKKNPKWFYQLLTVDNTHSITQEAIQDERAGGMSETKIQQEFYCSFDMPIDGSYYGRVLTEIKSQGKIGNFPHNPHFPVYVVLDRGYTTAMWFFQKIGSVCRFLKYHEDMGTGIENFGQIFDEFKTKNKWTYAKIFVPCDMNSNATKEMTGYTALNTLRFLGYNCKSLPKENRVIEGIARTDKFLRNCEFHEEGCRNGLETLAAYHEQVNLRLSSDIKTVFTGFPAKDGNDHCADSMRYASMALEKGGFSSDDRGLTSDQIKQLQRDYVYSN